MSRDSPITALFYEYPQKSKANAQPCGAAEPGKAAHSDEHTVFPGHVP